MHKKLYVHNFHQIIKRIETEIPIKMNTSNYPQIISYLLLLLLADDSDTAGLQAARRKSFQLIITK